MNEELKEKLIDLIKQVNASDNFQKPIVDFIKTYDGTNKKEFLELFATLVDILTDLEIAGIKADGYDALEIKHKELSSSIESLKDEYNVLLSEQIPQEPLIPASDLEE
jgi:hypothetical protein